jgi:heat shock protein HslJ
MGGYTSTAPDALSFAGVATTRMACPVGMDEEAGLLAALQDVARHRIRGEGLELLAADGRTLVRLIAVYF